MKIIIFGTVIRTRKSLEKIIVQAIKEKRTEHHLFQWAVTVYNTGIFGLVFYRTTLKRVGTNHFFELANKNSPYICKQ